MNLQQENLIKQQAPQGFPGDLLRVFLLQPMIGVEPIYHQPQCLNQVRPQFLVLELFSIGTIQKHTYTTL
jgi:hypothetical protein